MPWDCTSCGAAALLDDEPMCTQCGGAKAAWTMHANQTRTFRTTRREKLEVLRGTDDCARPAGAGDDGAALRATDCAVTLPKPEARQLAEAGLLPAPSQLLVLRLHPRAKQDPTVHLAVLHAESEAVPLDFPREPLEEAAALDVRFLLVHGPEDVADLRFEGLSIVDVTEGTPQGYAPQLGASALGARRRDLPIEPWLPRGHLHARLVLPNGAIVVDAALAWERDGVAVDGPVGGVTLPTEVGADGVIKVEGLPWGTYLVRVTPRAEDQDAQVALAAVALPLLREVDDEPHLQWVRFEDDAQAAADEPEGPKGHLHAVLVLPNGATVVDAALAWERDGAPVDGPVGGVTLPTEVGADGVIKVEGLPWGSYLVRVTPRGEEQQAQVALAPVALPFLREVDDEPHLQWVRFEDDSVPSGVEAAEQAEASEAGPRGTIHACLLRPDGEALTDASLTWERDGAAVDGAVDGVAMPTTVGRDGVIRVDGLPWGSYVVRATVRGEDTVRLAPTALPLLREADDEPHRQWVRFAE